MGYNKPKPKNVRPPLPPKCEYCDKSPYPLRKYGRCRNCCAPQPKGMRVYIPLEATTIWR